VLIKKIYQLVKQFPAEEKYGLVSQISKAAVSIAANIA
jgi:four helix bundle protein